MMKQWCAECLHSREMNVLYASYDDAKDEQLLGLECRSCHEKFELWLRIPPPEVGFRWVAGVRVSHQTQRKVARQWERATRYLAPELLGNGRYKHFERVEYRPRV